MLRLVKQVAIKGFAHITGGGLLENIPRVLPRGLGAELHRGSWSAPAVYGWLESVGVAPQEMYRTFNCGVGMIAVVAPTDVEAALTELMAAGEHASVIGSVVPDADQAVTIA